MCNFRCGSTAQHSAESGFASDDRPPGMLLESRFEKFHFIIFFFIFGEWHL